MRLGKYPCKVMPGTKMAECYGEAEIWERHRHRYEFNNDYRQEMQDAGPVSYTHLDVYKRQEQEYFLIKKEDYEARQDLILTGRTLFGARCV